MMLSSIKLHQGFVVGSELLNRMKGLNFHISFLWGHLRLSVGSALSLKFEFQKREWINVFLSFFNVLYFVKTILY